MLAALIDFQQRWSLYFELLRAICLAALSSPKVELLLSPLSRFELGLYLLKCLLDRKRRRGAVVVQYLVKGGCIRRLLRRFCLFFICFFRFVLH